MKIMLLSDLGIMFITSYHTKKKEEFNLQKNVYSKLVDSYVDTRMDLSLYSVYAVFVV